MSQEEIKNLLNKRLKRFVIYFIEDFECYIEIQRSILEGNDTAKDKYTSLIKNCIIGLLSSNSNFIKNLGNEARDCLMHRKKMDKAGKLIKLVEKYKDENEKLKIRKIFVEAAFEVFRSFEYQFMSVEKTHGAWLRAMLHLARGANWCFIRYYILNDVEELTKEFILEAITFKLSDDIGIWKKWWYKEEKTNTTVNNKQDDIKWEPEKLFTKVGILIEIGNTLQYYKSERSKIDKYGFRRIFSHEENNLDKSYQEDEPLKPVNYVYIIDMSEKTKDSYCNYLLDEVNKLDKSLMEKRLIENMDRICREVVEGFLYDMFQELRATASQSSQIKIGSYVKQTQIADKITNIVGNNIGNMTVDMG